MTEHQKPLKIEKRLLPLAQKIKAIVEERYPKCFATKDEDIKPLKMKIHNELYKELIKTHPEVTKKALKAYMTMYSANPAYKKCLQQDGAMRIDLQGNPIEPVSEIDAEHAKTRSTSIEFCEYKPKAPKKKIKDTKEAQPKKAAIVKPKPSKQVPNKAVKAEPKKDMPKPKKLTINNNKQKIGNTKILIKPKRKILAINRKTGN